MADPTAQGTKSLRRKNEEATPRHKVKKEKTKLQKALQNPLVILGIVVVTIVALVFGVISLSNWLAG